MKKKILAAVLIAAAWFLPLTQVSAMPVGTLLYRTSGGNKMYGYNEKDLIVAEKGKLSHIYSGHTAIYVGQENGVDYIVEMQPKGAIKVPAQYFINDALGEKLVAAKIPQQATPGQIAKAVAIAKNLADKNLAYDFDFRYQKGPGNGQWTCVGLAEKVYESANIANPANLGALVYDPANYAVDITPDGYDNTSVYNAAGDCFSDSQEFSKINHKTNMLLPVPEIAGYDVGLEHDGDRFIFIPYTQALQDTLRDVPVDINLSSSFAEPPVRGESPVIGLVLKWGLVNNPISTVKNLTHKITDGLAVLKNKIFPSNGTVLASNATDYDLSANIATSSNSKSASAKASQTKTTKAKTKKATAKVTQKQSAGAKIAVTKAAGKKSVSASAGTKKTVTATIKTPKKTVTATVANKNQTTATIKTTSTKKAATTKKAAATKKAATAKKSTTTKKETATTKKTEETTTKKSPTKTVERKTDRPAVPTSTGKKASETKPADQSDKETTSDDNDSDDKATDDTTKKPEKTETKPPLALIAQIYSNDKDDWLEISNASGQDFDLAAAGYRLEKAKTKASTNDDPTLIMRFGNEADGVYPGGTIIKASSTYLVANDDASDDIKAKADAIITKSAFSWREDGGTLYLGTASISSDDDPDIVDKVGYGDAAYFEGQAPAPALKKGYALERKASAASTIESLSTGGLEELWPRLYDSNDNSNDFLLVPYDWDVIRAAAAEDGTEKNKDDDPGLFVPPAGLDSEDMTQLWHFDECYGFDAANELQASGQKPVDIKRAANWLPGKWGCAASLTYGASSTKAVFDEPLDLNEGTINFYYRSTTDNFDIKWHFSNPPSSGQEASLELTPYYTEIYGFPSPPGRTTEVTWPSDQKWHQVTLVVDKAGGYWALYLDGQEKYRYRYDGTLPVYSYLEFESNQAPVAFDELSIWNRALPTSEIRTINLMDQPFNPYIWPEKQKKATTTHYWTFDENEGTSAKDTVGADNMTLGVNQWDIEGRNGSGLRTGAEINLPLTDLPLTDAALSFWWRNSSNPNEGRPVINLKNGDTVIMALTPTIYNSRYVFNGQGDFIAPYGTSLIPTDDKWHHLALVYDSARNTLLFYLDGELKLSKELVKLKDGEVINNLQIKQENWPSTIDELKIWSGYLTAKQIEAEYDTFK